MPGAARMYPETDVEPIKPVVMQHEAVELIHERAARYEKEFGLSKDLAATLAKSDKASMFDDFTKKFKSINASFIASTLVSTTKEIQRKMNIETLGEKEFSQIFRYLDEEKLSKDMVMQALIDSAQGNFDINKYALVDDEELKAEIKKIVDAHKGATVGGLMGLVMARYKGKVDGKKVMDILKEVVK
jgi:glutamyl-tRNA(Gln) amidotransferase subunit E